MMIFSFVDYYGVLIDKVIDRIFDVTLVFVSFDFIHILHSMYKT